MSTKKYVVYWANNTMCMPFLAKAPATDYHAALSVRDTSTTLCEQTDDEVKASGAFDVSTLMMESAEPNDQRALNNAANAASALAKLYRTKGN